MYQRMVGIRNWLELGLGSLSDLGKSQCVYTVCAHEATRVIREEMSSIQLDLVTPPNALCNQKTVLITELRIKLSTTAYIWRRHPVTKEDSS